MLHVCMGNICRSPMAERLLDRAVRDRVAPAGPGVGRAGGAGGASVNPVRSHSAGTGGWHAGEEMNPPAARQVLSRGGNVDGFAARKLRGEYIDTADLVLTATADQVDYVLALRPDAQGRVFVLGEFGRLLPGVDPAVLPAAESDPAAGDPATVAVQTRGRAIVAAVDALRGGQSAQPGDDLDDPWGRGEKTFTRIGDEIEQALRPFATLLLP